MLVFSHGKVLAIPLLFVALRDQSLLTILKLSMILVKVFLICKMYF